MIAQGFEEGWDYRAEVNDFRCEGFGRWVVSDPRSLGVVIRTSKAYRRSVVSPQLCAGGMRQRW